MRSLCGLGRGTGAGSGGVMCVGKRWAPGPCKWKAAWGLREFRFPGKALSLAVCAVTQLGWYTSHTSREKRCSPSHRGWQYWFPVRQARGGVSWAPWMEQWGVGVGTVYIQSPPSLGWRKVKLPGMESFRIPTSKERLWILNHPRPGDCISLGKHSPKISLPPLWGRQLAAQNNWL